MKHFAYCLGVAPGVATPGLSLNFYIKTAPQAGDPDCHCSKCESLIPEEEAPLLIWRNNGRDMAVICEACSGVVFKALYT